MARRRIRVLCGAPLTDEKLLTALDLDLFDPRFPRAVHALERLHDRFPVSYANRPIWPSALAKLYPSYRPFSCPMIGVAGLAPLSGHLHEKCDATLDRDASQPTATHSHASAGGMAAKSDSGRAHGSRSNACDKGRPCFLCPARPVPADRARPIYRILSSRPSCGSRTCRGRRCSPEIMAQPSRARARGVSLACASYGASTFCCDANILPAAATRGRHRFVAGYDPYRIRDVDRTPDSRMRSPRQRGGRMPLWSLQGPWPLPCESQDTRLLLDNSGPRPYEIGGTGRLTTHIRRVRKS